MRVDEIANVKVMAVDPTGPLLGSGTDATDLIGEAYGRDAEMIALPAGRLDPEFFRLASGLAGEFFQKMQNYGFRLAIVGDLRRHVEASQAFRDFIEETNRRRHHLFVADFDTLRQRLAASQ